MSRASVAITSARADLWHRAVTGFRRLGVSASSQGLVGHHPTKEFERGFKRVVLSRWTVPAAILAFSLLFVAISIAASLSDEDRALSKAITDLDTIATLATTGIRERLAASPHASADVLLAELRPVSNDGRDRIILTNAVGAIIGETDTANGIEHHLLTDVLGSSQALTIFGDKAGVMRLMLGDGTEALVTVRALPAPFSQLVVVRPIDNVLADWHSSVARSIILAGGMIAVLIALTLAYAWQTARSQDAELSCRSMRERVDMVLGRGRCGLWDWNLASGQIEWSRSMFEILGLVPQAKTLTFAEINVLLHPDDRGLQALSENLGKAGSGSADHVFRMRGQDGRWVWLRARAELVEGAGGSPHLVGIAMDISDAVALEERTAQADMRLRDAVEAISEAFVVWDAENRLVLCNSKFQRFHNLPTDAIAVGTPYASVMERGTPPLIQSQVPLGEAQPMGARTFEAQLGDGHWLQINERRTKDGGYVSVGTDITALKRNEEQLIESERRLMNSVMDLKKSRQTLETQAQQLAELAEKYLEQKAEAENANRAKSDFLANMGHELRTPLNAILGFSEIMMLESYGELGSPLYQEYSKDIHTSGQYLLAVIADVLEMSRLEAGRVRLDPREFSIGEAIESSMALIRSAAEDGEIVLSVRSSIADKVHADQAAVEKILAILLHNALKYTPAGGSITLDAKMAGPTLKLVVEDTGVGIAPEAIARLGKPFEQCDKTGLKNGMRGSGLGLAIARSLADLHGGTMRIESQQGEGTRVTVLLPDPRGAARPQMQMAASGSQGSTRRRGPIQLERGGVRRLSRSA